jgi:hypothetical protein
MKGINVHKDADVKEKADTARSFILGQIQEDATALMVVAILQSMRSIQKQSDGVINKMNERRQSKYIALKPFAQAKDIGGRSNYLYVAMSDIQPYTEDTDNTDAMMVFGMPDKEEKIPEVILNYGK